MPTPRTALVTGSTGGLGSVVTAQFRDAGYRVLTIGRAGADLIADLTAEPSIRAALDGAGDIDILVHLMGGFATGGHRETWDRMLALNLLPAAHLINLLVPLMTARGWGRILAVGSMAGESRPAGMPAYVASKAALHALIQATGAELKGSGVTANAVLPTTIGPAAPAAEIGAALLFLASGDAAHINGSLMPLGE